MLTRFIQFSLTQRLFILILAGALCFFGWEAFRQIPIDAFPEVSGTQVKIIMKSPGMTPEEMELRVAQPIEVDMLGIPKTKTLRTVAKYGLVDITLDFEDGTDIYWARQQVAERLTALNDVLPNGILGGLAPVTTPLGEMFMFTLESEQVNLAERRRILDRIIKPALRTVPGVAEVNILGGDIEAYEVIPNYKAMQAAKVSLAQIKEAILQNNKNDGAGRLLEGAEALLVRVSGALTNLDSLRDVSVVNSEGIAIKLDALATLKLGQVTRYGAVTRDGRRETVEGLVLGLAGANAQVTVRNIKERLQELEKNLPADIKIATFYDRAELINKAINTVTRALVEASLLVLVLLGLFLGNIRAALIVSLVLPLSVLSTFILMRVTGLSANLMSLGGIAIAIGMLVDASVVVVENIVEKIAHDPNRNSIPFFHLVYRAVKEVATPVFSGILIIVIVFIPLLTLQGLEGKLFSPVALTIVFALTASLVLSLSVIPVVATYFLKVSPHTPREPWLSRNLLKLYQPFLQSALRHPRRVFIGSGVALVVAFVVYFQLGKSFMPTMDEGDFIVGIEKSPSISLEESVAMDLRIQSALKARVPEIKNIIARVGSDEIGLDPMGLNQTDTFIVLRPSNEWKAKTKDEIQEKVRIVLDEFVGIEYSFTQPIEMRVSEMILGVRGDVAVKIFGPDLHQLNEYADQIEKTLKRIPGNKDVYTVQNSGLQYLHANINRDNLARFGMSSDALQDVLKTQIEGDTLTWVNRVNAKNPVVVRGESTIRQDTYDFLSVPIVNERGLSMPLNQLVEAERRAGPVKIDRENGSRYSVVIANVAGRDLVSFVDEAKREITEKVQMDKSYRITWGGQFENQQRAAKRLSIVVPIALALIFLILFSTFSSVRQALLVLSLIPFAMVGGVFGLWVTGNYISVPASVGFIALLGITVLNGVVLVSYINQLRSEGLSLEVAIKTATQRRLRPIMMTASITALGLIPLLLASGPGSEIQKPLAVVVIGGLVSATAMTLILLPLLYRYFENKSVIQISVASKSNPDLDSAYRNKEGE